LVGDPLLGVQDRRTGARQRSDLVVYEQRIYDCEVRRPRWLFISQNFSCGFSTNSEAPVRYG